MKKYITLLLFLTALAIRIPGLDRPLIMDEPKAIEYASISFRSLVDGLITDSQPPLYYCILKFWAKISTDIFFLRLLTVLLGAITCVILFKMARAVFNKQASYYTFVFAALSPQLIFQSQYLRPYCLGTFLSALLVYVFIKLMNDNGKIKPLYYFIALSVLTALCLYALYMSIFIIFALNIFAIYHFRSSPEKLLIWVGSQVSALCLFSFWVPIFLAQKYLIESGTTCYLVDIDNAKIGLYFGKVHVGDILRIALAHLHLDDVVGHARRYSEYIKYKGLFMATLTALAIPLFLCILQAFKMMFKLERLKGVAALFLLLISIPVVFFMLFSVGGDLGFWGHAVVNMRYFSQSSIYALIVLSLFLVGLKRNLFRRALFSCVIIFFLFLDLNIYNYPSDIYKATISYLSDKGRDCNVVVLGPPGALGFFNPLSDRRFSNYKILKYSDRGRDADEVKRSVRSVNKIYFYYFKSAENMVLFPGLDSKFIKLAKDAGFVKKDERKINDILIISYFERQR